VALAIFIVVTACAAAIGGLFEPGPWYEQLRRPAWNPPNWVFAPVWTALYLAIAIAGWRAWRVSRRVDAALGLWSLQLVLNALWSWLFFGMHRPGTALLDLLALLAAILAFIVAVRTRDAIAAWLFVPYAVWVTFAGALNFAIWQLN
jgi:tryptophan-rich sensory protein